MFDLAWEHIGSIIWVILAVAILTWELVGVFSRRVRTITGMFWLLIGYRPEERWVFSWRRGIAFILWLILTAVLTSHFFIGIPTAYLPLWV